MAQGPGDVVGPTLVLAVAALSFLVMIGIVRRALQFFWPGKFRSAPAQTFPNPMSEKIRQGWNFITGNWKPIGAVILILFALQGITMAIGPHGQLFEWLNIPLSSLSSGRQTLTDTIYYSLQHHVFPVLMIAAIGGGVHNLVKEIGRKPQDRGPPVLPRIHLRKSDPLLREELLAWIRALPQSGDHPFDVARLNDLTLEQLMAFTESVDAANHQRWDAIQEESGHGGMNLLVLHIPQWWFDAKGFWKKVGATVILHFYISYELLHTFTFKFVQQPAGYEWFNARRVHIKPADVASLLEAIELRVRAEAPPAKVHGLSYSLLWRMRYINRKFVVFNAMGNFLVRRGHMAVLHLGLSYVTAHAVFQTALFHGALDWFIQPIAGGSFTIGFLLTIFLMSFALNVGKMILHYVKAYAQQDKKINLFGGSSFMDSWAREMMEGVTQGTGTSVPVLRELSVTGLEKFLEGLKTVKLEDLSGVRLEESHPFNRQEAEFIARRLRVMHERGDFGELGFFGLFTDLGKQTRVEQLIFDFEQTYGLAHAPFRFDRATAAGKQRNLFLGKYGVRALGRVALILVFSFLWGLIQMIRLRKPGWLSWWALTPETGAFAQLDVAHVKNIGMGMIGQSTVHGEIELVTGAAPFMGTIAEGCCRGQREICAELGDGSPAWCGHP